MRDCRSARRAAASRLARRYGQTVTCPWLPPCTRDPDPAEQVWSQAMCGKLADFVPTDVAELDEVEAGATRLQRHNGSSVASLFKLARLVSRLIPLASRAPVGCSGARRACFPQAITTASSMTSLYRRVQAARSANAARPSQGRPGRPRGRSVRGLPPSDPHANLHLRESPDCRRAAPNSGGGVRTRGSGA